MGGKQTQTQKLQAGGSSSEASQHKLLNFMLRPDNVGRGRQAEKEREGGGQSACSTQTTQTHQHTHTQTDTHTHTESSARKHVQRKNVAVNSDCSVGVAVALIASVAEHTPHLPFPLPQLTKHASLCCGEGEREKESERKREKERSERVAANCGCRCGNPGNNNNKRGEATNETKRNEANKARRSASEVRREERKTLNDCMHD